MLNDEFKNLANTVSLVDELMQDKEYKEPKFTPPPIPDPEPEFLEHEEEENRLNFEAEEAGERKQSADVTAKGMVSALSLALNFGVPFLNHKFEKKLSESDWGQLELIETKDQGKLTPEEIELQERAAFYSSKLEKLKASLKLNDEEKEDFREVCELYAEETGFEMNVKGLFYVKLAELVGTRLINVLTA
jgi:hypothetical protein